VLRVSRFVVVLLALAGLATAADIDPARLRRFSPLPSVIQSGTNPITPAKTDLGRMLYYETRLSKSNKFSCNSCHLLDKYGVDNLPTSPGHSGQRGTRNSPTVYNAAGHFVQFWDGRAPDVEEQSKGPVLNPVEMAMKDDASVIATLKSMPGYVAAFKRAFPTESDPVTFGNFAEAVGAFERHLVTPSRWDRFLNGDKTALTDAEKAGFNKFYDSGCATCHSGTYLGGQMYQTLGVVKPWPNQKDTGRHQVSKRAEDRMKFKVPSLRNVEKTAPYLHDGSRASIEETIRLMGEYETGHRLSPADIASIALFLRSLTGTIPAAFIKPPRLPASSPSTPKPQ
jgi:cytochrome c peroxidase